MNGKVKINIFEWWWWVRPGQA